MGWFSKKKGSAAEETAPPPAATPAAQAALSGPGDQALDTLASVIRIFGQQAIDIDAPDQEDFPERCDAWEMHLRRNDPAPVGRELPKPAKPGEGPRRKAFADLLRFVTQRRDVERSFVVDSFTELRGVLLDLVRRLRDTAKTETQDLDVMTRELGVLSAAAENLSITELRAQVRASVDTIGGVLEGQRRRREGQMKALSESLNQTRSALVEAHGKAMRDALTGLDNRHRLDEELDNRVLLAQASGVPMCAVMIDLDHFKAINDQHGHAGGDEVLKAAARALVKTYRRADDLVCRFGGEEFCVLLHDTAAKHAMSRTLDLLQAFSSAPAEHGGHPIAFTASAGVAELLPDETGESLLQRADQALYTAKQDGRDRVVMARQPEKRTA